VIAASPVCAWPGCGAIDDLTADHVVPLSRGGTNDGARQVLCRSHNSVKGARLHFPPAGSARIVGRGYAEVIGAALELYPARLRCRVVGVDFLTGTDPVFAGLHAYVLTDDGRSYASTAHVAYPVHVLGPAARRRTTVVLPVPPSLAVVVHELAHVLDWDLGFGHDAAPVSWYARTNRREAMAEAVTSWLLPGYAERPDEATVSLLESLSQS
jgi:hypothetical protein